MKSTSSPSDWNCTAKWLGKYLKKALPIATSPPPTLETRKNRERKGPGCSTPICGIFPRKKATGALPQANLLLCAFVCHEKNGSTFSLPMRFMASKQKPMPTYHLASCADDVDLHISHVIRGQDHLSNTFKHVLIFEAAGTKPPQFAHLPLLVAPDGTKLSKRKHGPVVSVTTYRDAGFLPEAFMNFLCLLGWSPKNDREQMSRQELIDIFSLEGINRANAVVNFKEPAATPEEAFDPKAVWLNAEHLRALPVEELSARLLPIVSEAGFKISLEKMLQITPLIRERIKLLRDVLTAADFFFVDQLPPYDPAELIPPKADGAMAKKVLLKAKELLATTEFKHDPLDQSLRGAAQELGLKAGQMFQPIRVAVCGRKNAPPLFETLEVLGRDVTLARIDQAAQKLQ